MIRQAMVVSRKIDTPTAVVAMLGMASLPLPSGLLMGPSGREGGRCLKEEPGSRQ